MGAYNDWSDCGFTATCAAGYSGSPTASVCTSAGQLYVLGGCDADCTAPTTTGYTISPPRIRWLLTVGVIAALSQRVLRDTLAPPLLRYALRLVVSMFWAVV